MSMHGTVDGHRFRFDYSESRVNCGKGWLSECLVDLFRYGVKVGRRIERASRKPL
jgi:hypothetical protein